jgi:excisionase family DNA binding protein
MYNNRRQAVIQLFTIKQVGEQLYVTRKTVLSWIAKGELRAFKLGSGGRLWRITARDLAAFIRIQQGRALHGGQD